MMGATRTRHDIMLRPTADEKMNLIALSLEGFFYGLYSGVFAMYLQYQTSKKVTTNTQNVIFYLICVLYVLSIALFVVQIAGFIYQLPLQQADSTSLHIAIIQTTLFGCCDFIAQFILIYRCWIVWGRSIRVVTIPSVLAVAYLIIWLVGGSSAYIFPDKLFTPYRGYPMTLLGLVLSLTVNTLVTGLIVFRIFKVFRGVKVTSDDKILRATGRNNLWRVILVLIESGMALFSIQLARLVVTIVGTNASFKAFAVIAAIHDMLNGITPTIILVRTSMGLSFHDEKSMDSQIASLRFASNWHPNPVLEMGSISISGGQDSIDDIDVQRSDDIDIVDR